MVKLSKLSLVVPRNVEIAPADGSRTILIRWFGSMGSLTSLTSSFISSFFRYQTVVEVCTILSDLVPRMDETSVRVAVRVRPLLDSEKKDRCTECVRVVANKPQVWSYIIFHQIYCATRRSHSEMIRALHLMKFLGHHLNKKIFMNLVFQILLTVNSSSMSDIWFHSFSHLRGF